MNLIGESFMIVPATTDSRFREELQIDNEPISFVFALLIVNTISRGVRQKGPLGKYANGPEEILHEALHTFFGATDSELNSRHADTTSLQHAGCGLTGHAF
jgi:hypothetical protein